MVELTPGCVRTLRELAVVADVSTKTMSEWASLPGFPVQPDGSYNAWVVCAWKKDREHSKAAKRNPIADTDPLLAGVDSEALEAYRWQKAMLAGFDVEERRGNLIRRDQAQEALAEIARILRASHEDVQRQFGSGPHEILEDALREATIMIATRFGNTDGDPGPSEPEPDPE